MPHIFLWAENNPQYRFSKYGQSLFLIRFSIVSFSATVHRKNWSITSAYNVRRHFSKLGIVFEITGFERFQE